MNKDGRLLHWCDQGVLLLNTALTVRSKSPGSHTELWEEFTTELIEYITTYYQENKKKFDLVVDGKFCTIIYSCYKKT